MKTILVPTDFSEASLNAIRYILNFFQDITVPYKLVLLNAYIPPFDKDPSKMIEANDRAKKKAKEALEKEKKWALKISKNRQLEVETMPHMGSLENVIAQVIKEKKIEMIVMGKDGGEHVEQIYKILIHNKSLGPLLIVFS